jgi:hypothetical protein
LEEVLKPLTREELQNRVMDGVKKKELEAHKEGSMYDIEKKDGKTIQKQKSKVPIK